MSGVALKEKYQTKGGQVRQPRSMSTHAMAATMRVKSPAQNMRAAATADQQKMSKTFHKENYSA